MLKHVVFSVKYFLLLLVWCFTNHCVLMLVVPCLQQVQELVTGVLWNLSSCEVMDWFAGLSVMTHRPSSGTVMTCH